MEQRSPMTATRTAIRGEEREEAFTMISPLRRLATRVANAACHIPTHGRALVGLAVVAVLPLAAYGCGERGQSPDRSEIESRPWGDPMAGQARPIGSFGPEPCRLDWHGGDEDNWRYVYNHFIHWSPNGSHLVFDVHNTIRTLDVEGAELLKVADVDPEGPEVLAAPPASRHRIRVLCRRIPRCPPHRLHHLRVPSLTVTR